MNIKKIGLVLLALALVVSLALGGCAAPADETQPSQTGETGKTFTVTVVHKDKTEKTFTYTTTETFLGAALVAEGLIVESESAGMYNIVDGETADWNVDKSYWCFYIGDQMAFEGMNTTQVHDGDTFRLEYTIG